MLAPCGTTLSSWVEASSCWRWSRWITWGSGGGIVGRIEGVYVGSPHDLIKLSAEGHLSVGTAALVLALVLAASAILLWRGYLQPVRLLRTLVSPSGLWLLGGAIFLGFAAAEDANVFFALGLPRVEELLELCGATLWLCFALDVAGG